MKFLLIVLVIHFIGELIGTRKKNVDTDIVDVPDTRHPAEFNLRY